MSYRCANCGRKLKEGRWVFSRYTRQRYCWAGACLTKKKRGRASGPSSVSSSTYSRLPKQSRQGVERGGE